MMRNKWSRVGVVVVVCRIVCGCGCVESLWCVLNHHHNQLLPMPTHTSSTAHSVILQVLCVLELNEFIIYHSQRNTHSQLTDTVWILRVCIGWTKWICMPQCCCWLNDMELKAPAEKTSMWIRSNVKTWINSLLVCHIYIYRRLEMEKNQFGSFDSRYYIEVLINLCFLSI